MTDLERAMRHIKTRADAWAVKEIEKALSQEPTFDDECQKDMNEMWEKVKTEHDPCETCGYAEGSPFCLQYCPYDAERKKEQEPCTDAVSREAVIKLFNGNIGSEAALILHMVKQLPSVTQKSGKWIDFSDEGYVECPFCGYATTCEDNIDELHYCFYCGAKMESEDKE